MNEKSMLSVLRLPARLDVKQAAEILGFLPHELTVLLKAGLLKRWESLLPMVANSSLSLKFRIFPPIGNGWTKDHTGRGQTLEESKP